MKKLFMFFIGLLLLAMAGLGLYFSAGIFDAGKSIKIYPYFFQPNNLSDQRPGVPQTAEYIGEVQFMDLLVRKYITEYFYAAPDPENIAKRTSAVGILALMSSSEVFNDWLETQVPEIEKLAKDKSMRIVRVINSLYLPEGGQYWIVDYELMTWPKPNDLSQTPVITSGRLYMNIYYEMGMWPEAPLDEIHEYLETGGDPARVFRFKVNRIIQG